MKVRVTTELEREVRVRVDPNWDQLPTYDWEVRTSETELRQ